MKKSLFLLKNQNGFILPVAITVSAITLISLASLAIYSLNYFNRYRLVQNSVEQIEVLNSIAITVRQAYDLGEQLSGSGSSCPSGSTVSVTIGASLFCFPAATNGSCISTQNSSGAVQTYCIETSGAQSPTASIDFNFQPEKKSFLEEMKSYVYWKSFEFSQDIANLPDQSLKKIVAYNKKMRPGIESAHAQSLDPNLFLPNLGASPPSATINVPDCSNPSTTAPNSLHCMNCERSGVTCIQVRICPPFMAEQAGGCTANEQYMVQRFALY